MDLVETEDKFVLRADLQGVSEEDVKVELDDNVLTVSGERKPRKVAISVGGAQPAIEGAETAEPAA
jgi:HSP20 family molecular chaperone IbpA